VSKYLEFRFLRDTGNTKVYGIHSKSDGGQLGTIKWYDPWRQYILEPWEDTVWNAGCLEDVSAFMRDLMQNRRQPKASKPCGLELRACIHKNCPVCDYEDFRIRHAARENLEDWRAEYRNGGVQHGIPNRDCDYPGCLLQGIAHEHAEEGKPYCRECANPLLKENDD